MSTRMGCLVIGIAAIIFILYAVGRGSDGAGTPATRAAADSIAGAVAFCRSIVEGKLTSPTMAKFSPFSVKRDPNTGGFVGRGEVTAPNAFGVPITHRFICLIDAARTGKGNAIFESGSPALYAETIRIFDL